MNKKLSIARGNSETEERTRATEKRRRYRQGLEDLLSVRAKIEKKEDNNVRESKNWDKSTNCHEIDVTGGETTETRRRIDNWLTSKTRL